MAGDETKIVLEPNPPASKRQAFISGSLGEGPGFKRRPAFVGDGLLLENIRYVTSVESCQRLAAARAAWCTWDGWRGMAFFRFHINF